MQFRAATAGVSFMNLLFIGLAPVGNQQHHYHPFPLINTINYSPISYPIAKISRKRPLEPLDIRMFVRIFLQVLKTPIEPANQRSLSLLIETLGFTGQKHLIHLERYPLNVPPPPALPAAQPYERPPQSQVYSAAPG